MASQYFIRRGSKVVGPVSLDIIERNIVKGRVAAADQVSETRNGQWRPLAECRFLHHFSGRLQRFRALKTIRTLDQ